MHSRRVRRVQPYPRIREPRGPWQARVTRCTCEYTSGDVAPTRDAALISSHLEHRWEHARAPRDTSDAGAVEVAYALYDGNVKADTRCALRGGPASY